MASSWFLLKKRGKLGQKQKKTKERLTLCVFLAPELFIRVVSFRQDTWPLRPDETGDADESPILIQVRITKHCDMISWKIPMRNSVISKVWTLTKYCRLQFLTSVISYYDYDFDVFMKFYDVYTQKVLLVHLQGNLQYINLEISSLLRHLGSGLGLLTCTMMHSSNRLDVVWDFELAKMSSMGCKLHGHRCRVTLWGNMLGKKSVEIVRKLGFLKLLWRTFSCL